MHTNNKIGWQKYEDLLHDQIDSPLLDSLYKKFMDAAVDDDEDEGYQDSQDGQQRQPTMPIDERLMDNISLANNFECWMGHTNFNITEEVKEKLKKTTGVEVLKICSRYRFFVGIGKMFDFTEVRANIDKHLENQGTIIEPEQKD